MNQLTYKLCSEDNSFICRACIVLACLLTTFILLQNIVGASRVRILQPLDKFPKQLGQWILKENRQSSTGVIKMLGVNDYIDYTYQDNNGNQINFYVGFYESVGITGSYHSPKHCMPGSGWGIDKTKTIKITKNSKIKVNISEMIIRNGSKYQVVLYWFNNRGRIIASEYLEKIYLVFDALTMKRRDGSFIRLMAQARDGDIKKVETLLIDFSELAIPQLDKFIPGKILNTI